MSWPENPGDLLAGPRGRDLCWRVLERAAGGAADLDAVAASTSELALLAPLADAVCAAMYWQEPDAGDRALAHAEVAAVLRPVADAVTAAPAARWWPGGLGLDAQRYVQPAGGPGPGPPALSGAADRLAAWRAAEIEEERSAAKRPADPAANWSGHWWSGPNLSGLVSTTRALPGLGAVQLAATEDSMGWTEVRCWALVPQRTPRLYRIAGPADRTALVQRYPLDVSKSRRHDWYRATGCSGSWLMPDYAAVAADYDAVHLTVGGYLTTAGRALPVDDARTMLAGWDPDETYWLADILTAAGEPVGWTLPDQGSPDWRQAGGTPG
ncbi:MAG: hypothetical protein ACLQDY_28865 [Streptosporangiaceae bacterium]